MTPLELDTLRRRAIGAYVRWSACEAGARPPIGSAGEQCDWLKSEMDYAAQALLSARRPIQAGG